MALKITRLTITTTATIATMISTIDLISMIGPISMTNTIGIRPIEMVGPVPKIAMDTRSPLEVCLSRRRFINISVNTTRMAFFLFCFCSSLLN